MNFFLRRFILKIVRGVRKEVKVSRIRFEDKYVAIQELFALMLWNLDGSSQKNI